VTKRSKLSKYVGVTINHTRSKGKPWRAQLRIDGKQQHLGRFKTEIEAAKCVNFLCKKHNMELKNPELSDEEENFTCPLPSKKKEKLSNYKGVSWHEQAGKWCVLISLKKQKQKYGGLFKDELDAAKRVNQICVEMGIPSKNPEISAVPNQDYQKHKKTSKYVGIHWHKHNRKWVVQLRAKGEQKYCGVFKDEVDAAQRANQVCENLGISLLNPAISAITNQQYQRKEKTSQFKGVYWAKYDKKWRVQLCLKGRIKKYGGYFNDELDAAKKVNQLCEDLRIPLQNPECNAMPNQQKKEKTSQFKGVYWHKKNKRWNAQICKNGKTQI